jgi:phosphatidate cytidylyltransferase
MQDVVIAKQSIELAGPLGDLLHRGSLLPILFIVVLLRGAVELDRILRAKDVRPHSAFAYLMIVVLLLTPWFSAAGFLGSDVRDQEGLFWQLVALMVTVMGAGVLCVLRGHPRGALPDMAATLLMVFFVGFLGSFGLQLRCGRDIPGQEGAWLLLITLLVTKASDIGAYFVGTMMGRHKLIPGISPAKSIEGAVGGLLSSAVIAVLFSVAGSINGVLGSGDGAFTTMLNDLIRSFSIRNDSVGISPIVRALLFGLALSAAGQVGDLVESCFKRDSGVKDSGNVIPRYGGILDLIDSPVFAMPVAWFLLTTVWSVV